MAVRYCCIASETIGIPSKCLKLGVLFLYQHVYEYRQSMNVGNGLCGQGRVGQARPAAGPDVTVLLHVYSMCWL